MKFYLDTVSPTEIQEIGSLGILDGIAMNASLVSEQGLNFHQWIREICLYVDSPISMGVVSIEEEAIVKEGIELSKIHSNVLVKCPLTPSGLKATKRLTAEDIRVNVSLCFSLTQALIAAKSGAWCVSICPDYASDNQYKENDITRKFVKVFRDYGLSTQVLLADIRSPHEVLDAALAGGHICTMQAAMFRQLFDPAV